MTSLKGPSSDDPLPDIDLVHSMIHTRRGKLLRSNENTELDTTDVLKRISKIADEKLPNQPFIPQRNEGDDKLLNTLQYLYTFSHLENNDKHVKEINSICDKLNITLNKDLKKEWIFLLPHKKDDAFKSKSVTRDPKTKIVQIRVTNKEILQGKKIAAR